MIALEDPWDKSSWTTEKGYKVNSEYHGIRHYSKYVSRGWSRIEANTSDEYVQTVAFASPENDTITLVAINSIVYARPLNVNINTEDYKVAQVYQSVETGPYGVNLDKTTFSWLLPPKSITTIVLVSKSDNPITALEKTAVSPISAYCRNNSIYVSSGSSALIRQISVYTSQGQLVSSSNQVNAPSYEVKGTTVPTIYVVKVVTDNDVKTVKVLNH
jgi:ribulose bisphosphate carboxylase small subunit